ncbi:hypothetical protein Syun_019860 [Stephania yunnanensis]|uniref:Uncharacterized protein n=1 Tax=Stephania yunnanensis TaxID=152371 RepID=A0AAP0NX22_9MAGN
MGDVSTDEEGKDITKEYVEEHEEKLPSVEFKEVPPWRKQITVRGIVASFVIGSLYSLVIMKLNLTTGLSPNLNVSAALVAFIVIQSWTKLLQKFGISSTPFTPQENTVIQTCTVACYAIAYGGGFGSYLLGLSKKIYELAGVETEGNAPGSYKEPGIGWMTGFLFVTSFVGLLILVPLRKIMIVDYKLTYPSGTASAVLINGFHSSKEDKNSNVFMDSQSSFRSVSCGVSLSGFSLGKMEEKLVDLDSSLLLDWELGDKRMICPHLVNLSLLLGAVLSWGIMWPLIHGLKGHWYSAALPESSMKSLQGYKVFIAIALILGDGLYNFVKVITSTSRAIYARYQKKNANTDEQNMDQDELHQNKVFMRDHIPVKVALLGYVLLAVISTIVIPHMFPQLKWYYVIIAYIIAPALGFCNAYGAGLTDMNMAYNYGKVALFALASIAGKENGVVAGLAGCGLIKSIASISSDLMHDLKTGHLTYTSPRSMIISQAVGTAMGCIVAPLTFFLYFKAFDVGNPNGVFKAPYGIIYRNMAIVGVEGFSTLPHFCLNLCYAFFAFAIAINLLRDYLHPKIGKYLPIPMAMAVPFLVGAYFAIDMALGSLIVFTWHKLNSKKASVMVPAVASGLICGDGLWTLPSSILALAKVHPPICMTFLKD